MKHDAGWEGYLFAVGVFTDVILQPFTSHCFPSLAFFTSVTLAGCLEAGSWWMGTAEEVWLRFDPRPVTESRPMEERHLVT